MRSLKFLLLSVFASGIGRAQPISAVRAAPRGVAPIIGAVGAAHIGRAPQQLAITPSGLTSSMSVPTLSPSLQTAQSWAAASSARPTLASARSASLSVAPGLAPKTLRNSAVGDTMKVAADIVAADEDPAHAEFSPVFDGARPSADSDLVAAFASKNSRSLSRHTGPSFAAKTRMTSPKDEAFASLGESGQGLLSGILLLSAGAAAGLLAFMLMPSAVSVMALTAAAASGLTITAMFTELGRINSDQDVEWGQHKAGGVYNIMLPASLGLLFGGLASALALPVSLAAMLPASLAVITPLLFISIGKNWGPKTHGGSGGWGERAVLAWVVSTVTATALVAANYFLVPWASLPLAALIMFVGHMLAIQPPPGPSEDASD